jgi:hypothetical protein
VLYATGFEPPTFTTGPVNGQDGWAQDIGPASAITIQTAVVESGSQALELNPAGQPDFTRVFKQTTYDTAAPGADKYVLASTDFYLSGEGTLGRFSFVLYTPGGANNAEVVLFGPDLYILSGDGQLNTGKSVSLDAWHSLLVELDYTQQVFNTYLDGGLVASGQAFAAPGDAVMGFVSYQTVPNGSATALQFADNLSVSTSATPIVVPVPEPASLATAAIAAGLLACARSLRRRSA